MSKLIFNLLITITLTSCLAQSTIPEGLTDNLETDFMAYFPGQAIGMGKHIHYTVESNMLNIFPNNPKLTIIIHGFKTSKTFKMITSIKDALLNLQDKTLRPDVVVIVDWRSTSNVKFDFSAGYKTAAKNTETISKQIAYI